MTEELVIGVVLLATAAGLMFVGLPNKAGVSPRFLRFEAAIVLYPPVVMVFFAGGIAEIVTALLRTPH
jgi:hypothetical protein